MLYTSRLYFRSIARVLHGQIMMMKIRGYENSTETELSDEEILEMEDLDSSVPMRRIGVEDKLDFLRSSMNCVYRNKNNRKDKIHIYYVDDIPDKVTNEIKAVTNLVKNGIQEYIKEENVKHIIIISSKAFPIKNLMEPMDSVIYEYFEDKQLLIVPTETINYTRPVLLSLEEGRELLESYKVKHTQLPRILFNDPLVRFWGWGNIGEKSSYMNRIIRFDHETPFKTIVDGWIYYRVISPVVV